MSCEQCQDETDIIIDMRRVAFLRVGRGEVAVIGCDEHVRELFSIYRAATPVRFDAKIDADRELDTAPPEAKPVVFDAGPEFYEEPKDA